MQDYKQLEKVEVNMVNILLSKEYILKYSKTTKKIFKTLKKIEIINNTGHKIDQFKFNLVFT